MSTEVTPEAAHTPLPWGWWPHSCGGIITETRTGAHVAVPTIGPNRAANSEFIVRAVNCHDDLLAALKGVVAVADRRTVEFDAARAAIAKAEGG